MKSIIYIGMDVHKKTYSLCALLKETGEIIGETKIPADVSLIIKFIENAKKSVDSDDVQIKTGYEAGCLGYSLYWQLAEKGIGIQFKYKGQTDEVQGISFSKGEYTFKGSEIDRNFSYYKLDKYFGDAGLTTAGSNRQSVGESIRESVAMPGKADNSFVTGLGGLFSASSSPADEIPDNPDLRKKKKKKKRQFKL